MADQQNTTPPPHILAFPLPKQGHINPLLQFSKRIVSRGVRVTLLLPSSTAQSLQFLPNSPSLEIHPIPDSAETNVTSEAFRTAMAKGLADFISRSEGKPKFIVYDSLMPWILIVAKRLGLEGAPFFTQSCAVNHIYNLIHEGDLEIPVEEARISVPCLPILDAGDLPISYPAGGLGVVKFKTSQFLNLQEAKWLFCNTFDKLENAVINKMGEKWAIKTIGPTVPSLKEERNYGICVSNSQPSDAINEWLDSKRVGSVVYVSFGSILSLEQHQVKEIACSLREESRSFLWVMGDSEKEKLPANFVKETCREGLVVSWCRQLEVLTQPAVGCFVSHCGWNLTLEALSLGVPMVAVPKWSDQTMNAKFIADVWEVGVRAKVNEEGVFSRVEIAKCIREVMEGERGKEVRENAMKWKELAREAIDEGGSSYNNIDDFVTQLLGNSI